MIVCQLDIEEWDALTPSERDAIRLGFNTFEVPEGASIRFENEWAWLMQLQRYDRERARELYYTGVAPEPSFEERMFHRSFALWLMPKKEKQPMKKMLRFSWAWFRDLFSGFSDPSLVRNEA
jgi:hypothetical protein